LQSIPIGGRIQYGPIGLPERSRQRAAGRRMDVAACRREAGSRQTARPQNGR
jgi:hypothetical protein